MLKIDPNKTYGWLYKNGESTCLELDGDEYSKHIADDWGTNLNHKSLPKTLGGIQSYSAKQIRKLADDKGINPAHTLNKKQLYTILKGE